MLGSGTGSGTRTHTMLPPTDFESVASTNSAIPAIDRCLGHRGPKVGNPDHPWGFGRVKKIFDNSVRPIPGQPAQGT